MRIALICVYFGEFPSYFSAFLKSAEYNQNFDFYIYTDNDLTLWQLPKNVILVKTNFETIKNQLQKLFDFPICLNKPYKLTDFKPVYGHLFEKDIQLYSHWGYFDLDIILGDLSLFASNAELSHFDRIGSRGHLSIFKNTEKNKLAYRDKNVSKYFQYREAFTSRFSHHFDEMWGINNIFNGELYNFKDEIQDGSVSYFDASPKLYPLVSVDSASSNHGVVLFWNKGKLSVYQDKNGLKEISYVHLQKRKMTYTRSSKVENTIVIDQNKIIIRDKCDMGFLLALYQNQLKKWPTGNFYHMLKYYYNTLISGEQISRIKLKLKR